ncbi:MAG: DUF1573 domain-containing protein [Planctomycetota bacterium]|nr:DUF1573 domain-containing protein [Planctomycetota bacterium]
MSSLSRSRSGRIELIGGLLLLAGIVGAGIGLALARSTPVEPGVVVDAAGLDFGGVWEQPAYRHEFTLSNPTDSPIRIAEIKTGCGCTRVEPQSFTIEPGETQSLAATLDLTGRGGGPFAVDLLPLLAHQPPGDRTVWVLRGKVWKNPIELAEPSIDFGGDVILGEPPPTREIVISLSGDAGFEALEAHVVEGQGSVTLEATDADLGTREGEAHAEPRYGAGADFRQSGSAGASPSWRPASRTSDPMARRWRLLATPPEGLPIGPFQFTVRLEPTSASSKPLPFRDILVKGTVRDDIAAWPATVNFGVLEVGETGQEYVVLSSHRNRSFEVVRIETPEGVTAKLAKEQLEDGSRTFVVAQTAMKRGDQKGEIVFHVRREKPGANASNEVSIRVQISVYGMTAEQG